MTFTHALSTNNYGSSKFIVDSNAANGTHTTIAAALASASSGDTIFIRPGTFTENLILKAGVNLCSYGCEQNGNVNIVGKLTATFSGTCSLSGLVIITNSDFALSVTGSNATVINLFNSQISCSNNTGIQYTSSNAASAITLLQCYINTATTGIAYHTMSSAGIINYLNTITLNSGSSLTAANNSAGDVTIQNCSISGAFSTSSTGHIEVYNSAFTTILNLTMLAINGTGASSTSVNSSYLSAASTSSLISVGAGATLSISEANISCGATYAISGSGTLNYAGLSFVAGTTSTLDPSLTKSGGVLPGSRNAAPSAGYIGESITSANTSGVGLSNATPANVTSISLTAGIWDVSGAIEFAPGAGVTNTSVSCSISTTSATNGTTGDNLFQGSVAVAGTRDGAAVVPQYRLTLTTTTTTYLVANANFSGGTLTALGRISATRVG